MRCAHGMGWWAGGGGAMKEGSCNGLVSRRTEFFLHFHETPIYQHTYVKHILLHPFIDAQHKMLTNCCIQME